MAAVDSTISATPAATVSGRVVPQLTDLMKLAARVAALPNWSRAVNARQQGDYRAPLKGRGMEYAESRPYQAGDDVRAMDWRLTARIGKPHTKMFREERERPVYLCVDFRANMQFATQGVFKSVQAARAAALLAWKASYHGDRVGGLVFSDNAHHELEPARGNVAVMRFLKLLTTAGALPASATRVNGESESSLGLALRRLRRLVKPGSLVFMVSDGREFSAETCADLAALSRHCDVGLVLIHDAFEAALPSLEHPLNLTARGVHFTLPGVTPEVDAGYRARFEARLAFLTKMCREQHLLLTTLQTTDDPVPSLQRLLGRR